MNNIHQVMFSCEKCISESIMKCELNAQKSRHTAKLKSDSEILHSRISVQDRGKKMNTLLNYT